ncbi:Dihydroneopterin aldolase 1 [Stylosanthes scabra]|uniref:7,8-dihydroneopterin aldolase n=1 Tax=Stylosanthes scabra TaxID=79078 RepID=A0ABU6W9N5_9FABA|nr:Dihydroneopterin aldolase 1 [Stylosanthes scabra]
MDAESLLRGDKLILRGLLFHGFHGVNPEERISGQKFMVDIDAWMDLRAAGKSDNLSDSVSYTDIYQIAQEVIEGPPHNLLESVAHKIATTTLTNHHQISAVRVLVGKPQVAVKGKEKTCTTWSISEWRMLWPPLMFVKIRRRLLSFDLES